MTTRSPLFDRVSEDQRACLRLVLAHMTSKEIGRALDVSHHTVDQRVKTAMRILRAESRVDAARMLAEHEHGPGHQPLVYQAPELEDEAEPRPHHPPLRQQGELPDDAGYALREERAGFTAFTPAAFAGGGYAFPPDAGGRNDLTAVQRLGIIAAIAIGSALSFGAVIAGLEALSRIV